MMHFSLSFVLLTVALEEASSSYSRNNTGPYSLYKFQKAYVVKGDCPHGWHRYEGNCYYFSRDQCSWYEASMRCTNIGGFLVTVEKGHENSYIIQQLKAYGVERGAWMGLNTIMYPEQHLWCWGITMKPCQMYDWYGYEPMYRKKGDYYCAIFWKTYKYHWHVNSCSQKNYYVCKITLGKKCRCPF